MLKLHPALGHDEMLLPQIGANISFPSRSSPGCTWAVLSQLTADRGCLGTVLSFHVHKLYMTTDWANATCEVLRKQLKGSFEAKLVWLSQRD